MTNRIPKLASVSFPKIGAPNEPRPSLPARVFTERLAGTRAGMKERGLDALVIYGDREHVGNLHWLTNYDPRFEEALLIVYPQGAPILFVGNEGMGYSQVARLAVERRLYQTLSLLGQPREKVKDFAVLLREAGLGECGRVGVAGWKYFSAQEFSDADGVTDLPEFLARAIRRAVKDGARVTNETALFMHPEHGLRHALEAEQIADFEWVATHNSNALLNGIRAIRPGRTEMEVFAKMTVAGLPFSAHPVCASGENVLTCMMPSPSSRKLRRGDPMLFTCTYQGANTCRFGWVARDAKDLPRGVKDYVKKTAAPYFAAVAAWWETFRVGATGDELHRAVHGVLKPHGLALGLNAGHQIAVDEWTHSPVTEGSQQRVQSGMYFQCDFFPMTGNAHFGAFAEDGVVAADAALRKKLAAKYPAMWKRFQARRKFMREQLGINISEDVLPMSNYAATVMPFLMSPTRVMSYRE